MLKHQIININKNFIGYFNSRNDVSLIDTKNCSEIVRINAKDKIAYFDISVYPKAPTEKLLSVYQFLTRFCVIPRDKYCSTDTQKCKSVLAFINSAGNDKYNMCFMSN